MFYNKPFQYSRNFLSTALLVCEGEDEAAQAAAAAKKKYEDDVAAAVAKQVEGLKNKNNELIASNKKLKETQDQYSGLDLDRIKALQEQIDQDEDMKLLSTGKKHEFLDKHTTRMREENERKLAEERERTAAEARRADKYKDAVLDNQIRAACVGMHPAAIEDALLHGRQIFQLDAEGKAVKPDSQGIPELGKDGASPFSPKEWMDQQRELRPHWFPMANSGTGANNGRDASGNGKTLKRAEFDKLSPTQQSEKARSGIKIID